MKSITHGLLEDITDPFSVFSNKAPEQVLKEDHIEDAQIIVPSVNSIKEEFNRASNQDRIVFLQALINDPETCKNIIILIKENPKTAAYLRNQANEFPFQHSR